MQLSFSSKYSQIQSICESVSVNSLNTKRSQSPGLISADCLVLTSYLILLVSSYAKLVTLYFMVSKMHVYFFKYHCNQGCITTGVILGFSSVAFLSFVVVVVVQSDSFAIPWAVASQAPLSVAFSRQEYWSGFSFPSPGDLPSQPRDRVVHKTMTSSKLKASQI